jgi:acetoacetate decarboxylase
MRMGGEMSSMSFRMSKEDLSKIVAMGDATFTGARVAWIFWETEKSIVDSLLPPGLTCTDPIACAYVSDFPKTNFSPPYNEGALFVTVNSDIGRKGVYCLAMPITDEVAMFSGRDVGFPKKMAKIGFKEDPKSHVITGTIERHGVQFARITLAPGKAQAAPSPMAAKISDYFSPKGANNVYNIYSPYSALFKKEDAKGLLLRQKIKGFPESAIACEGTIDIKASKFDPWAELKVVQPLGGIYFIGKMTMGSIDIEREIDLMQLYPLYFKFYDVQHYVS